MKHQKSKRYLFYFIGITLISGWLGVAVDHILTEQPEGNSLGMGVWLILPFLSAIIFRAKEHDWKSFGIALNLKSNCKWYILSIFIYPIITAITLSLALIFNCAEFSNSVWNTFLPLALSYVLSSFIKNIFEEFAWRGYLTPKLMEQGLNDWMLYGVSGLIWGLWHTAYYIVFLPDTYFQAISRLGMVFVGCVLMIAWSILFVEIYRVTYSVWPCVILHAMEDAVPTALVTNSRFVKLTTVGEIFFNPITGIVAAVIIISIGLFIRKKRIFHEMKHGSK